jgi:hypothetical protein
LFVCLFVYLFLEYCLSEWFQPYYLGDSFKLDVI